MTAKSRGSLNSDHRHGTWSGYTRGCRCSDCRAAQHRYYLAHKAEIGGRSTARYRSRKAEKS